METSIYEQYANLLEQTTDIAARLKELKPQVIAGLKTAPSNTISTSYGDLEYELKQGNREVLDGIENVVDADILVEVSKVQLGLLDKAIKAGKIDSKVVEPFIGRKESTDNIKLTNRLGD
jgi:hypothetical protein